MEEPPMPFVKRRDRQVTTCPASIAQIMGSKSFALGVEDCRRGAPPQFDREEIDGHNQWDYERGRLWALIAPVTMPLRIDKWINPSAVALYRAAHESGWIL
jgi:hypothetical protein